MKIGEYLKQENISLTINNRVMKQELTDIRSFIFSNFGDYGTVDQILAGKGHIETDTAVKAVIFYLLNKPA